MNGPPETIRRQLVPGHNMHYKEFTPNVALRPYIRSYFHLRVARKTFQLPADGCPCLMISVGDPFVLGFDNGNLESVMGCRVVGASTRWSSTTHVGQTNLVIVRFAPGQISRFFRVPALDLTDTSASLESLWGKSGRELAQRLTNQNTAPGLTKLLDSVFLSLLSSRPYAYDMTIQTVLDLMSTRNGQANIERIAARFGLSRRHLERRFADSVGLTPKRMCRIIRFSKAFSCATTYEGLGWSQVAYMNEYSDQAHLIRECKFFTGYSPICYFKNRSSLEHSVMCTVNTIPD